MRILKLPNLPNQKTWVDKDVIMLHACFEVLTKAVEEEKVHEHVCPIHHKDFAEEVKSLYVWWQIRKTVIFNEDEEEDDKMLLRLMKIRRALWT